MFLLKLQCVIVKDYLDNLVAKMEKFFKFSPRISFTLKVNHPDSKTNYLSLFVLSSKVR